MKLELVMFVIALAAPALAFLPPPHRAANTARSASRSNADELRREAEELRREAASAESALLDARFEDERRRRTGPAPDDDGRRRRPRALAERPLGMGVFTADEGALLSAAVPVAFLLYALSGGPF